MNQFDLKAKFIEEFFEEFQSDAEIKSKKELFRSLEKSIKNEPRKLIVTKERFEQLKDELNNNYHENRNK